MKTYTGYFYETVCRQVFFSTQAESEDEARANLKTGDANFDIDGDVRPVGKQSDEVYFDPEGDNASWVASEKPE